MTETHDFIKCMEALLSREEFIGALKFHSYLCLSRKETEEASVYLKHLIDFEARYPTADRENRIGTAVARQLSRSIELNSKMRDAVRALHTRCAISETETITSTAIIDALAEILRMS